jgi:hypothetical protein
VNRHRRYLIGLAVAIAATAVLLVLLTPGGTWVALDQRRSSLRATPDGVAAWYQSLSRLDVQVAQRFTSFTEEDPRGAAIVLLEPVVSPTAAEIGSVLRWIREGGMLVYSPASGSILSDSLGLRASLVDDLEPTIETGGRVLPHRWTSGVEGDADVGTWVLDADSLRTTGWVPLAVAATRSGARRAATLAWVPLGAGGVLALAEAEVVANRSLDSTNLSVIVTRALADVAAGGDTVFFAEYHQGIDGRRGLIGQVLDMASDSPVGRAATSLAVVGLVLLFATGRSFGAPVPLPDGKRRSPLEHVEALGRIYEISGAERSVARRLVHGAARRMGMRARTDLDEEQLIEIWRARPHLADPALLALGAWKRDPPDLSALAVALDGVVEAHTARDR